MIWNDLNDASLYNDLLQGSKPFIVFKHSTRCPLSFMAKKELESNWNDSFPPVYLLDLIRFRSLSNHIASSTGVRHESPQMIIISNGNVVHHSSHSAISVDLIKSFI